uniref:Uncharacterized protein n=1 Tax=Romanomermis culicivorax TaxID=13658 RepID=A0A915JG44_ROMCU
MPSRRPVLFSESTYPGSGTYAYHWISGTESTWANMKASLVAAVEYNFFGLPFTGSDVCGYKGDVEEELCVRWWQIGAFLPLCRSGNAINAKDQDPASLNKEALNATRLILHIRYKFLPYLYTILWFASTNGTSVIRPLFFEFPHDNHTYDIDDQFLLGTAIMVTPILEKHARQRSVYFPAGRWFQLLHGAEVENATENRLFNVSMDLHEIGLYVKGGNVVPWQYAANNTVLSRRNALGLTVALDTNELSHGYLFWDDGITPPSDSSYHYSLFLINVTKSAVTLERLGIDIFTTMLTESIVQWIYEINRSVL